MRVLFFLLSFLVLFTGIYMILKAQSMENEKVIEEENTEEEIMEIPNREKEEEDEEETTEEVTKEEQRFETIKLKARSAMVWDMQEERPIYEKNSGESLPLASITKIMTAIVASEKVQSDMEIMIEPYFLEQHGQSGLLINEAWYLKDLIDIIMLTSANDAAYAIAAIVGSEILGGGPEDRVNFFVSEMNKKAGEIGLSQSFFNNPTGLDVNEMSAGAYGSADDIVKLVSYAFLNHPEIFYPTKKDSVEKTSLSGYSHHFTNTNPSVHNMNGLVASKTGYTDLAGGNLAVVVNVDLNYPVIIVVMGSTFEGRFEDALNLIEATHNHLHTL